MSRKRTRFTFHGYTFDYDGEHWYAVTDTEPDEFGRVMTLDSQLCPRFYTRQQCMDWANQMAAWSANA